MIKVLGSLIVIFAGIGFGFHKAAKEQRRLEQGIAIKRMLYLLQGEIRYGFTPLPEAVLKISTKTDTSANKRPTKTEKEYQPFLKNVAKQLETHSEESFAKVWQQAAEKKLKQVIYEPKFYEILKNMGETIGYLDQQMQEKTILLTIEQLDDQIFLMKDQVVKNCKMYRSLGISLSVLIVIILL